MRARPVWRTRPVIARRAAPWQSLRSINRRMDCFVPRNDGASVLKPRPSLRARARHCEAQPLAARSKATWRAVAIYASIHSLMDCFVPRNDGASVLKPRPSLRARARHCEAQPLAARSKATWRAVAIDAFGPQPHGLLLSSQ
jgi:hypothetical protein